MEILDAHTLSQNLDTVLEKLKCAAKLNVAFGFVLKNVEDGSCRYYYAHENNAFMERLKCMATKWDFVKLENVLNNTDVIQACTKERANTNWNFYALTNMTVLLLYSEKFPWGVKTQYCQSHLQKLHC